MEKINICDELHQNFIDFAHEANSQRAFPDARDGLKPGQRACLWEMYTKGYTSAKPHVKSAKISGGVIGAWWPHGDVAIYETFARMSQPWVNNIPEVDWHGANGNQIMGSSPANQRYTEARLSKASEQGLLDGLKKNIVPMIPNFSEDDEWPLVFPAIFPRLLVNGSQGIGVTIANTWLPMNLNEVADVIINYLDTDEINLNKPLIDFPSGGIIINEKDLPIIHKTGKGKAILRAKTEIKKNSILITELPYQVYVEPFLEDIKNLIIKGELEGIKDFYNKSDKKRLLIEIECEDNPSSVLSKLFKLTDLQKSYSANQWALVGKTPKLLTLTDYIKIYVSHNLECIQKEYQFDLKKAEARKEIVDGLLKALEDIDNIIALIKASKSSSDAKLNLQTKYSFTENQAKAIVDMKLGRLAHLEKIELNEERTELENKIKEIADFLSNSNSQKELIKQRLLNFVKKFGFTRRSELTHIEIKPEEKEIETVVPEPCVIIISQTGEIKRVPASSFKLQNRNGKGVKTVDDALLDMISTNTVDTLMLFTDKGKMYRLLVDNIPVGTNASKGVGISSIVKLEDNERVVAITSLYRKSNAQYVIFITKNGLFKKTRLEEYMNTKRSTGIAAINLKEGDAIANVTFANEEDFIVITKQGMSIHFETKEINAIGRIAAGVKSIKLNEGDEVLVGLPIKHNTDALATFSANGTARKTEISEFFVQGRGGKGLKVGSGELVAAALVSDEDHILIIGKPNSICISAKDIPLLTRTSSGNIMIKNSTIKDAIKVKL